jgi:UbiD family decarboxylase
MSYQDLREFIARVEKIGALRRVLDVDPHVEIGDITEVASAMPACPALLFDRIKGFPAGFRVFTNALTTPERSALALGIDHRLNPVEMLQAWMTKRQALPRHKPAAVKDASFLDNTDRGENVDLYKFPVPFWHRGDGGPYIGTGSIVVTRDPDDGWVNASIYRVQLHSKDKVTVQFDHPGRHGAIIARKYWERGQACPIAVVTGIDPAFFIAGFEALPSGYSEYDFAGAIKGVPAEIAAGPDTGLEVPARAEIVLEGALLPISEITLDEGPFGEFTGYYATERRPCPVMDVRAVHYRNDPILLGAPPLKPPRQHMGLPFRAAATWTNLEASGVTDVAGVWQHVSSLMMVVSLKQRYDGHAKRAGLIAAANAYMGRLIVVVDEDIDPSNLNDVMWAIATRCEPSESLDIVRNGWSSALDPRIPPQDKLTGTASHSKAIIVACRPFSWRDKFPPTTALTPEQVVAVKRKWLSVLEG